MGRRTSHFIHDGWIHSCSVDSGDDGTAQLLDSRRQIEAAGGVDCFRRDVCCARSQFLNSESGSGLPAPTKCTRCQRFASSAEPEDGTSRRRLVLCMCALRIESVPATFKERRQRPAACSIAHARQPHAHFAAATAVSIRQFDRAAVGFRDLSREGESNAAP